MRGWDFDFAAPPLPRRDRAGALAMAALVQQAIDAGKVTVREISPDEIPAHNDAGKAQFAVQQRARQRNGALKSALTNCQIFRKRREKKAAEAAGKGGAE